jgi:hypothetical protein
MSDPTEPILSRVYKRVGIATAIVFVLLAVALFVQGRVVSAFLTVLAGIGSMVICFGIAELVRFIAEIARNTHNTVSVLQRHLPALSEQRRTGTAEAATSPLPPLPSAQRLAGHIYHYAADGGDSGPFSPQDMKDFRAADVLSDKTLVFKDGESEWRPFSSFPELRA